MTLCHRLGVEVRDILLSDRQQPSETRWPPFGSLWLRFVHHSKVLAGRYGSGLVP